MSCGAEPVVLAGVRLQVGDGLSVSVSAAFLSELPYFGQIREQMNSVQYIFFILFLIFFCFDISTILTALFVFSLYSFSVRPSIQYLGFHLPVCFPSLFLFTPFSFFHLPIIFIQRLSNHLFSLCLHPSISPSLLIPLSIYPIIWIYYSILLFVQLISCLKICLQLLFWKSMEF